MEEVIKDTPSPRTQFTLLEDLKKIGLSEGDILLVHSSMKSLGFVSGGAQAVIETLCTSVGEQGTIVMPAQSGDWSDPAEWQAPSVPEDWHETIRSTMPAFDPQKTPTFGMGVIPELFRTYPGTVRSGHPAVSFAARGKHAAALMEKHPLDYGLGEHSPLKKLEDAGAKVLLLGAGYETATCFHLAEYRQPEPSVIRKGAPVLNEHGEREWKEYEEIEMNEDRFLPCGMAMEHVIDVQKGTVGSAETRLFSLAEAAAFATDWLNT